MKIQSIIVIFALFIVSAAACLGGCANQKKVAGHWRTHEITANGKDDEWQKDIPQYYNDKQHLTIRILNDDQKISITASTSAAELQRQLQMSGLTVWLDPQGGKEKVFGLHIPSGGGPPGPPGMGGHRPPDRNRDMQNTENRPMFQPIRVEPIKTVSVTYSDTTGPLEMTIEEIRRTGIDMGVGRTRDGRLVYELDIKFSSAPSLEGLKPGMMVGIGFAGNTFSQPGIMDKPPGMHAVQTRFGNDTGYPAGGLKGPGGNNPPHGGKDKAFEIWLKVRLAIRATE